MKNTETVNLERKNIYAIKARNKYQFLFFVTFFSNMVKKS